jgi:DNA gyrase subunit A
LFFTNRGKVYWQKVYDLPELKRDARGRAIVNLLNLAEGEKVAECIAIRDFEATGHYLMMATRKGLVKKSPLEDYSRPKKGGIIAIKLRDDDEVVDVVVTKPGDEVVLASAAGLAIRFSEADARPMGRNTSGVKGIGLVGDDTVVGMVVADPEATLLTVCEKGYGKRTPFGPNEGSGFRVQSSEEEGTEDSEQKPQDREELGEGIEDLGAPGEEPEDEGSEGPSGQRYRTQRRGGKGLRDIKTTDRNGPVIGIARVDDRDELLMMTARGKLQRIKASDVSVIGRNTQGVRIMSLDEGDTLVAVVRVPPEEDVAVAGQAEPG